MWLPPSSCPAGCRTRLRYNDCWLRFRAGLWLRSRAGAALTAGSCPGCHVWLFAVSSQLTFRVHPAPVWPPVCAALCPVGHLQHRLQRAGAVYSVCLGQEHFCPSCSSSPCPPRVSLTLAPTVHVSGLVPDGTRAAEHPSATCLCWGALLFWQVQSLASQLRNTGLFLHSSNRNADLQLLPRVVAPTPCPLSLVDAPLSLLDTPLSLLDAPPSPRVLIRVSARLERRLKPGATCLLFSETLAVP